MHAKHSTTWQAICLLVTFFALAFFSGCTCSETFPPLKERKFRACRTQGRSLPIEKTHPPETFAAGTMNVAFSVGDDGQGRISVQLATIAAHGVAPEVMISGGNDGVDGILGGSFSLSAASVISRCPRSLPIDGKVENVQYNDADLTSLCLDGKRLVVVSRTEVEIFYRLLVDQNVKVVGHFKNPATSYLEAFLPDGSITQYGATAATRPMATENNPRAWLATSKRDARGVGIDYGYCFAENGDGSVAEYALDRIDYGSVNGNDPIRSVALVYGTREDARLMYSHGLDVQQSLRLDEVLMFGPGETLVTRYPFSYEQSESTGRTLLHSVQECGADGACKAPTQFHYTKMKTGFDEVVTNIEPPLSDKTSPMFFDVNHDGLSDYVVGDSTPSSTPSNPITEWRIAKNTGGSFAPEKVALLQDGLLVQDPGGPSDPTLLQPELGTAIDVTGDSNPDLFLHNVASDRVNYFALVSKPNGTFAEVDTNIRRPFPIGPSPKGLRNSTASTHLLDATGDQMADLVVCNDHGDTIDTALLPTWTLHAWRPGGFDPNREFITTLWGIPCGVKIHTVDSNNDSITDLIVPGYLSQGGVPVERTRTYDVHRRHSDGKWEVFDTGLPTPLSGGRVVFVDVNGDGLPDAIKSGVSDGRLYTYMNTGLGFAAKAVESLPGDSSVSQSKYFQWAQPLDWDSDGRGDLFVAMVDANSPNVPRWVILHATGGKNGFTFEQIDTTIPFEAVLGDVVDIADPRGPRILDFDGNGAPDVAIFLGKKLHIFKNRAVDPDVLVGFSDASNDHDPDEPGFVPNVSIEYAHLTDDSKAKGQPAKEDDFYISQADPANDCTYPRNCVVGAKRVVRRYSVNDGQGGVRRFELRYRDGRSDRLHGFLGFGERILVDLDTGATTATFYDNETKVNVGEREVYPFAGQVVKLWRWAPGLTTQPNPDRVEMAFTDRTLEVVPTNNGQTFFTLATHTHTRRMQGSFSGAGTIAAYVGVVETLESATMLRDATVDVLDFDEFHNVLEVKASTLGVDATVHMTRTVKNDVAKWMLGLPDTQTECSTGSGLTACRTITRTTNEFGEVETESTSSSDNLNDTKLSITYKHDDFGNVTHVTATDAFGHKRETTNVFDDEGLFPLKHINALGHETTQVFDKVLGVLTKQTDPNGVSAEWSFDSLGRLESETRADGSATTIKVTREKVGDVWRLIERTTTTGGGDDETIVDSLGRPHRTFSHGPEVKANTPRVMQVIEYDRLSGQVARKSVPTAEGTADASLKFDEYDFDAIGREIRHVTPWNAVTTTKYDGLLVDMDEPLLKHTSTQVDTLGRPVTITDAKNGLTKYKYGPFDALYTVTDPGNAVTKWTRDAFGRVRQLDEPDRGTTHYVNDGFGDLVSSTDALGRVATWEFDALGRTTKRLDKLGGQASTTTWTWDTALHGIGRLFSVTSPDGVKAYGYNKRGQTESITLGVGVDQFAARLGYDDVGHVKTLDYPQPLGAPEFGVAYDYDPHGFRIAVRDKATTDPYWELKDVDNAGRYKEELFGNGTKTVRGYDNDKRALKSITTTKGASTIQQLSYDWDERLNLKSRTDALQPQQKTERFKVDGLDRLTCAYFSPTENANAACHTSYGYAANGNLISKSDVGILSYTDPTHPHAVTNAAGGTYGYNAVGNQITRPGGVGITFTPFDLPKTITQGAKVVSFGYDGDQQRIRKTTSTTETLTFGDLFEQVTSGGVKEFRYYVQSPERTITIVTRGGAQPGTKYLHVDHLGSTETITKENGTVDEKRSYDPFGQRRNVIWGLPPPASFTSSKVKPGFTAHDEEDEFGLVNMKGRLFDPHIGRFLNTDPIIANVFDGQTLNAFSYVGNNPLTLIDPTGFAPEMTPDLTIPGIFCCIEQTVVSKYPDGFVPQLEDDSADTDTGTTGPGDGFIVPLIETDHPSGPGTDDPFGVYPPDVELGYPHAVTIFDELVAGDPAGGRTTFIIEDDPGIGRDIRIVFGAERQTIMLRPRIGGDAGDEVSRAKQNLVFEVLLTAATVLTPGQLDDIAAVELRGAARGATKLKGTPKIPRSVHNNRLDTLKPAQGYVMRNKATDAVLKYGESTQLRKRYTQKYLDSIGAEVESLAKGTKREMHYWQHDKILKHKAANGGKRPPLNKSDW